MLESAKSQPHINFVATDAKKNQFFNGQLYKGDIGQNFEKMKKICQG